MEVHFLGELPLDPEVRGVGDVAERDAVAEVGRARASVAGIPRTASYPAIATEISASVMFSWLIVMPMTRVLPDRKSVV